MKTIVKKIFPGIVSLMNASMYDAYHVSSYCRLFSHLKKHEKICFCRLKEFQGSNLLNKLVIGIRHDIDSDITTALKLAKIEKALGVVSTYYVLPTAQYYGRWKSGTFIKNKRILYLLRQIQDLGHEVGLHNDCLFQAVNFGVLPEESLGSELSYLRKNGIEICGTTSHGGSYLYLADNSEIFKGLACGNRRSFTDRRGRIHKLGHIDMRDFGLSYEGNFISKIVRVMSSEFAEKNSEYIKRYPMYEKALSTADHYLAFSRDYDSQYGVFGRNFWSINSNPRDVLYPLRSGTEKEILDEISNKPVGQRIILDIHPIYYGRFAFKTFLSRIGRLSHRCKILQDERECSYDS